MNYAVEEEEEEKKLFTNPRRSSETPLCTGTDCWGESSIEAHAHIRDGVQLDVNSARLVSGL